MTDILIGFSGRSSSWATIVHSFVLLGNFSRMCVNALLAGQCSIVPSAVNIDRETTLTVVSSDFLYVNFWSDLTKSEASVTSWSTID